MVAILLIGDTRAREHVGAALAPHALLIPPSHPPPKPLDTRSENALNDLWCHDCWTNPPHPPLPSLKKSTLSQKCIMPSMIFGAMTVPPTPCPVQLTPPTHPLGVHNLSTKLWKSILNFDWSKNQSCFVIWKCAKRGGVAENHGYLTSCTPQIFYYFLFEDLLFISFY